MKLTTKGQYAIVALTYIKNNSGGKPVRIQDIAASERLSSNYLEQLFRKLRVAGIVESVRGPHGGYRLLRKTINFREILVAVGESVSFSDNLSRDTETTSTVIEKLDRIRDELWVEFYAEEI